MALDATVFSSKFVTLTPTDYTGSPNTLPMPTLVGDVVIPRERAKQHTTPMVNSSAGLVPYGTPVHGLVAQPKLSFSFLAVDTNDNAEVTAPVAFFRALSNDSVAGTAYSGWDLATRLTGGGKLQVKLVFAEINEAGVTHSTTVPAIIESVVDAVIDGVKAITVNGEIVGALTPA